MIVILFGYGVASMAGNAVTGRLVDKFSAIRVLTVILVGLFLNALLGMVALMLAPLAVAAVWGLVWFFAAGVGNGGAAVPQQARLASLAPDSAAIVMALNGSAISLGAALGSGLGGVALTAGSAANGLLGISASILAIVVAVHLIASRKRQAIG